MRQIHKLKPIFLLLLKEGFILSLFFLIMFGVENTAKPYELQNNEILFDEAARVYIEKHIYSPYLEKNHDLYTFESEVSSLKDQTTRRQIIKTVQDENLLSNKNISLYTQKEAELEKNLTTNMIKTASICAAIFGVLLFIFASMIDNESFWTKSYKSIYNLFAMIKLALLVATISSAIDFLGKTHLEFEIRSERLLILQVKGQDYLTP